VPNIVEIGRHVQTLQSNEPGGCFFLTHAVCYTEKLAPITCCRLANEI